MKQLATFLSHCVKLSSLLSASRRPINNWKNKPARCGVPLMHIDKLRNPNYIWTPLSFCLVAGRENSVLFPVERLIFGKSFDLSPIIAVVPRARGSVAARLPCSPQANADPSVINCLHNLSRRIAIVLQHEERRCQYLTREAKLILAIQDEVSAMSESECFEQQWLCPGTLFSERC